MDDDEAEEASSVRMLPLSALAQSRRRHILRSLIDSHRASLHSLKFGLVLIHVRFVPSTSRATRDKEDHPSALPILAKLEPDLLLSVLMLSFVRCFRVFPSPLSFPPGDVFARSLRPNTFQQLHTRTAEADFCNSSLFVQPHIFSIFRRERNTNELRIIPHVTWRCFAPCCRS